MTEPAGRLPLAVKFSAIPMRDAEKSTKSALNLPHIDAPDKPHAGRGPISSLYLAG